mgnify:CR=1 FL=1
MAKKIFKEAVGYSMYNIERKDDFIQINYRTRYYNPDPQYISQIKFHISNIPNVLKGIEFVFRAQVGGGELYQINMYGDKLDIVSNTEFALNDLWIATYLNQYKYDKCMHFNFEKIKFPVNGMERVYTPAMVWVTKQMKKVYNQWQQEHPEYEKIK